MIKTHPTTVVATLAVVQLASLAGCEARKTGQEVVAAHQAAVESTIAKLGDEYKATTDWAESIDKDKYSSFILERQEALDPFMGRPIIAQVNVGNICRVTDGYRLICFLDEYGPYGSVWEDTYFVLEISQEKARQLMSTNEPVSFDMFAAVVVPSGTESKFHRESEYQIADHAEGIVEDVELHPTGELWIRGKCLDIRPLDGP